MTKTVKRPAITQAMVLSLLKREALLMCDMCSVGGLFHEMEIDHHLALVDGGAHDVENMRFVCIDCHKPKSAREHKNNAKAKRLAKAKAAHEAGEKKASRMRSRGFDKSMTRKFDGRVVPRNPATAET